MPTLDDYMNLPQARYGTRYIEEPLSDVKPGEMVSGCVKIPLSEVVAGDEYVLDDMLPRLLVGDMGLYDWEYKLEDVINGSAEEFLVFLVRGFAGDNR